MVHGTPVSPDRAERQIFTPTLRKYAKPPVSVVELSPSLARLKLGKAGHLSTIAEARVEVKHCLTQTELSLNAHFVPSLMCRDNSCLLIVAQSFLHRNIYK